MALILSTKKLFSYFTSRYTIMKIDFIGCFFSLVKYQENVGSGQQQHFVRFPDLSSRICGKEASRRVRLKVSKMPRRGNLLLVTEL